MASDLVTLDSASPALGGSASTIPTPAAPSAAPLTWQQMLAAIASLSGSSQSNNISGLMQGLTSNVNSGIPLYRPPMQAMPLADEQQKQTSAGDVDQYAKVIASIFGAG